jgi:simple sugar transport system permease protein
MALNLVAAGVTGTAYAALGDAHPGASLDVPRMSAMLASLSEIPILGAALFSQSALTWAAFLLVPLLWWYFEKTERGLELRAVGENPEAAEACGINVRVARWKACLASGALCGLGGAFLTVSQTGSFAPNCTGGRGFVVLAAVVLGRHGTWGTTAACLFFGAAFYARGALAMGTLPSELAEILPYALTLAALCWKFKTRATPAALGKPF